RAGAALRGHGKARHRIHPQPGEFRVDADRQAGNRNSRPAARAASPGARPQLRSAGMRARDRWDARADAAVPSGARGDLVNLIVFDMDGVLVDVTESYRETIQR